MTLTCVACNKAYDGGLLACPHCGNEDRRIDVAANPFNGAPLAPLPIRLTCLSGDLYLGGEPLIYFYPAGDVDCLPWPLVAKYRTPEILRDQLRCALQDSIETGDLPSGTQAVMLPDGTIFALYALAGST